MAGRVCATHFKKICGSRTGFIFHSFFSGEKIQRLHHSLLHLTSLPNAGPAQHRIFLNGSNQQAKPPKTSKKHHQSSSSSPAFCSTFRNSSISTCKMINMINSTLQSNLYVLSTYFTFQVVAKVGGWFTMPRISKVYCLGICFSHTPKLNPPIGIPKHWPIKNSSIHFNTSTKLENLSPIQKQTTFSRNILPETCRHHFPTNLGHCHVPTSCHQSLEK